MKPRILLLYGKHEVYDNPLAIEYLRTYCLADPFLSSAADFEILTFEKDDDPAQVADRILKLPPAVLGASCYVWNTDDTLRVCDYVKRTAPSTLIVLGGPEVGHLSEEVCKSNSFVDVVVSGEGEATFLDLLTAHLSGLPIDSVSGLTRNVVGHVAKTKGRPTVDLAAMPVLFKEGSEDYISSLNGKVLYETLRGCPHVCFFCDWGVMSGGRVRFFPIERIRSELDFILRHDSVRHLYITDSEINVDDNHAKQVLRTINALKRKYRWDGTVTFHLEISKEIDTELADLICEATSGIGIGVQSLNESALYQMGRRWFNRKKFEENVARLEPHVHFVFQFIYGCPGDTYDTFRESLEWAVASGRDVWFDRLRVLPGTIYRRKPDRFELEFDRARPNYVLSANTFSPLDIDRAESLKRGFLLYTYREFVHMNALLDFLRMDTMELLESFGQWCSKNRPAESLALARTDPPNLPSNFFDTLGSWIGQFVLSASSVDWFDYQTIRNDVHKENSVSRQPTLYSRQYYG